MPRTTPPWEIKRELLTKAQDNTNPKYGHLPSQRTTQEYLKYGTINLDKPAGPTSHEVAAWVKRIMKLGNIGHGGTLDPKVTGVYQSLWRRQLSLFRLSSTAAKNTFAS